MNPFHNVGISIPSKYLFTLPRPLGSSGGEQRFILAAQIPWVREVMSENKVPPKFPIHDDLTDDDVQAHLSQGNCQPLGPNWLFLHLTVVKVSSSVKCFQDFNTSLRTRAIHSQGKLTWPQLVDFIGESNFNFLWEQPQLSLQAEQTNSNIDGCGNSKKKMEILEEVRTTEKNYLSNLMNHVYPNAPSLAAVATSPVTASQDQVRSEEKTSISSLSPALAILLLNGTSPMSKSSDESYFFVLNAFVPFTLQDCVKFSPHKLNSHLKYLFILYQILQFISDLRDSNIPAWDLGLGDFRTDECLYLSVVPKFGQILGLSEVNTVNDRSDLTVSADEKILSFVKSVVNYVRRGGMSQRLESEVAHGLEAKVISSIVKHWCEGIISNYDYIMVLNFLCGRICDGNPNFHPVFPWVTDFTTSGQPHQNPGQSGHTFVGLGWRDLTKSKFRLNKGERQLDLMFEEAGNHNSVPHHVTDILSEITFYVYKARQTPKEILCKFVRPKWVPAEYPISIQRMQEWTPDECIPEFYDDPNIFKSIHPDLADLQVPKWSKSAEDFIYRHRQLLESEMVSAKLHHWIDLTFGFKLSGNAAVKSKNIYLALADNHQQLEKSGILQIFHTPHPPRKCRLREIKNTVTFAELKRLREADPLEDTTATAETSDNRSPTKAAGTGSSSNSSATTSQSVNSAVWKNISLPKHYDPMGFLNDLEVSLNFFRSHFNEEPQIRLLGLKNREEIPDQVKLFGCLLLELTLTSKFSHISSVVTSVQEKFDFYKKAVNNALLESLPLFAKRAVQAIFLPHTLEYSLPLQISLSLFLKGDRLSPLAFPRYFPDVLKMVRTLRNFDGLLQTSEPSDTIYRIKVQELKVKSFSRDLISILNLIDEEGLEIILPFVIELFHHPETRVLAVWNLFCPISRAIGRKKSIDHLLLPIVQIYESDYHSEKHLKLFHRSFLLQLMSCFGLQVFLENFATLLIEAIGGWKNSVDTFDTRPRTHLNSTDILEIDAPGTSKCTKKLPPQRAESETVVGGEGMDQVEPEMFLFEPETSASDYETEGVILSALQNPRGPTSRSPSISGLDNSSAKSLNISDDMDLTTSGSSITIGRASSFGSVIGPVLINKTNTDISEMCCESIIWLAHRLGPVLSAKFISRNLLRMLTLCYYGHLEGNVGSGGSVSCEGDEYANRVLECLIAISDLYGDCFIERQYLPYAVDLIHSATIKKMNGSVEAAIVGVGSLLQKVFVHMPDALLLSQLREPLMTAVLAPLVTFICTDSPIFPSGAMPRALLASKTVAMLNAIRKKIGPDLSQHLKPLVLQICSTFHAVFTSQTEVPEMKIVFGASLAYESYLSFCDLILGTDFETLIRDLYYKYGLDNNLSPVAVPTEKSSKKRLDPQSSSFGSRSFGNRVQIEEPDNSQENESSPEAPPPRKDTTRHLKGNWLIYWDHEVGRFETKFDFKQIKLQNFVGHTGAIRSIFVLNNENSFLTASKDKCVKLFSLRNQGDETTTTSSQWTYSNHKKSVLSVIFNEPLHLAASTDGFIHVWDPFVGKIVRILDQKNSKGIICSLKSLENTFVGAGIDSTVHVIDPRSCHSFELRIGIGQNSGLVRCMSVSPSRQFISVGHSSGMISILDLRNGTLLGSWKAHEGEILQLMNSSDNRLISSSFDQNISVWNILDDHRLAFHMRGPTEPVHSISAYENELITCTTSNRIGVHSYIDPNSDFSSTRLRSDTFKGIVTTMTLLPLNQILLVGSDSGTVTLLKLQQKLNMFGGIHPPI
ncbi:unnamed protein product [Allacma fusca]|uniref:BEACH domain-containing protein n=1 Tax=Allacma fusca TaxID=39272 RepID=A0A8J2K9R6_9HEXA|nr:unnamed protein product [Allacma fusca]